jgi:hypothetical protein
MPDVRSEMSSWNGIGICWAIKFGNHKHKSDNNATISDEMRVKKFIKIEMLVKLQYAAMNRIAKP